MSLRCWRADGRGRRLRRGARPLAAAAAVLIAAGLFSFPLSAAGGRGYARAASPPRAVLTLDDGYNFDHRIVDYLESQDIAASAFVIGSWAQRNPSLLQEMDSLGWDVCNHTMNHPWLTRLTDQEIAAELNACRSVIGSITGQYLPIFRPPGGFIDARVTSVAASLGYAPVMWDFDSMDALSTSLSVQERVSRMVGAAGDGDIFLFHFGGRNTLELVMGVVQGLRERGFVFITLSELYGWKSLIRGGESGPGTAEPALLHYFAEGTTRPGFTQWLLVLNPGSKPATVRANYYSSHEAVFKEYTVPPRRRLSISVAQEVPWQDDVAVVLESSVPVAVERMLYFIRGGGMSGGSLSRSVSEASTTLYFPEGTVRQGFEEYLAVFNPSGIAPARLEVELHGAGEEAVKKAFEVAPLTRFSVRINDMLEQVDHAMTVRSDIPVVAERSEYFVYNNTITGSHSAQGASRPNGRWFFAEGTTRSSFESYLTVFNPCASGTWLELRIFLSDGSMRKESMVMAAGERKTLHLNSYLPADIDYSLSISSLLPVVAERATYFQFHNITGGYCSSGVPEAREHWLFSEGSTARGFSLWLALFNPHGEEQMVNVEFLLGGGKVVERDYLVPAEGRITVDVFAEIGEADEVSIEVTSWVGVVAERSLYFDFSTDR
jgi:peptidoglycan-N-acetylglucosamine deacetylase